MSIATERKVPWNTRNYPRIVAASYAAGMLTVSFADGATVAVEVAELLPPATPEPDWRRLTHNIYEIVVPTEGDDLEIPWDVIRALTDPTFEQFLAKSAAESAEILGSRVRALRQDQRLSKRELAARADVSPERLARIEAGRDGISLPTLERLVVAMGHDMRVFIVDDDQESEP